MSKFLPERKRLLEEAFEKASNETPETSFSGILKNLEIILREEYKITLSYKTFENYYKAIVKEEGDYPTKPAVLDDLSRYLGFDSFNDYCSGWKSFEYKVTQALSKLVITVINKPIIKVPEIFTKQSSLGILGVLLLGGFFAGNKILPEGKEIVDKEDKNITRVGIVGNNLEKKYMYWNGERFIATDSSDLGPQKEVIPMKEYDFKYLQRITRPDTLTVDNASGKVWYDKSNGDVDFFTSFGINPETGKTLKEATDYMLAQHGGENAPPLFVEE